MVPTSKDIPIDWRVHLLPDAPNPVGVNSSKGTHRHTEAPHLYDDSIVFVAMVMTDLTV